MKACEGGQMVALIKKKFGLKYFEMSHVLGFGENSIKNWCNGRHDIPSQSLITIIDFYSQDFNKLRSELRGDNNVSN